MNEAGGDILVASGLHKSYTLGSQELEVLRGIDVRVRRGEALVIVGASGAGKARCCICWADWMRHPQAT
jgi:ABC-type lipoprotein export system ATPase subunit